MFGRSHYIKICLGNLFFCNGPVAFCNEILSRITDWVWVLKKEHRSESFWRGRCKNFLFFGFCSSPLAEDWGTIDSNCLEMCRKHSNLLRRIKTKEKQRKRKKNKEKRKKVKKAEKNKNEKERARNTSKMQTRQRNAKKGNSLQPHLHQCH